MDMYHPDWSAFERFTGPQRIQKAINVLGGFLDGIAADREIVPAERLNLERWLLDHSSLRSKHPFPEIIPVIESVTKNGWIEVEDLADLRWLCARYSTEGPNTTAIHNDMQVLHGLMSGLLADGRLPDIEIDKLADWVNDRDQLRGIWPFDELESVLLQIRRDKTVTDSERLMLKAFLEQFTVTDDRKVVDTPLINEVGTPISGLCAVCPEVSFSNKVFCFTGASAHATRKDFARIVHERGGICQPGVTRELDFLVVGNQGNPAWAFCCYGRKIEQVVKLRKAGLRILLVNEMDFWDALH